ncbi:MAG TPA: polyprenyl synthetase family protein [Rectinemataceae bacterium]|nr:polyprenyl synthetase family protein [Rectinemataceae bacterium]
MSSEYTEILGLIEREVLAVLPEEPDDSWFDRFFGALPASPRADIRRALNAPALELVRRGGKRWRPLLLVLSARALGREDGALSISPVVEIAHNGTLIVDDIEDGSDTRRGGPAIHLLHGIDASVNAGNLLYFLPLVLFDELRTSPATRLALHARYALHMRRLHLGQAMDITWHRDHGSLPDRDSYLAMCALKTGVLARAAAELGALAALAPEAMVSGLGSAFERVGVAFQILDDVANLRTGNPGKKRGDDIVEGKKSLPVILACEREAGLAPHLALLFDAARAGGPEAPAVEEAIGLIAGEGAVDAAEAIALEMLRESARMLSTLVPPGPASGPLLGLVDALSGRGAAKL